MTLRPVAVLILAVLALTLAGCGESRPVRLLGKVARASSARPAVEQRAPQPAAEAAALPAVPTVAEPEAGESAAPAAAPAEPTSAEGGALAAWAAGLGVVPAYATEPPAIVYAPSPAPTLAPPPSATPPPTATPDPFLNAGPPAQLDIPAIGVVALVEHVGLTADGAMDTPRGWMNAAWFNQGFRPGEAGNSVIAGHLDSRNGGPAVFWDLNRLQPGDEVTVTYQNGDRYTFAVQDMEVVPYDVQGDKVSAIFGPSQTSDLNLITCNGEWDRGKATYTQRLVVYTTLLPEKTVRSGYQGAYD